MKHLIILMLTHSPPANYNALLRGKEGVLCLPKIQVNSSTGLIHLVSPLVIGCASNAKPAGEKNTPTVSEFPI